jgi:hypothetical protein
MSQYKILMEELDPSVCNIITESSNDGKSLWLNGIMMQSEIINRNKRKYSLQEISNAIMEGKKKILESNGILGELDHPQSLTINLDRVSHVITDLWMNGNDAYGKAKIIEDTPTGAIAKALIKAGVRLGVSSRGAGNVNESGIVTGFNFITVDIVANPSAQNAYPNSVYESIEHAQNGKEILSLAESIQHDDAAQKYFKREIMKFLSHNLFTK